MTTPGSVKTLLPPVHRIVRRWTLSVFALIFFSGQLPAAPPPAPDFSREKDLPEALLPWQAWATWDAPHRNCPTPSTDSNSHLCFWPSRLALQVESTGGRFTLGVTVYADTWVPLPGDQKNWPRNVKSGTKILPVLEHDGHPAVELPAGLHTLQGEFDWSQIPSNLQLPQSIGLLTLTLNNQPVPLPSWDASGLLWLNRGQTTGVADKDFLDLKVNSLLKDGIPLWLHTEIELIVAGKNREESLESVLPQGWNLSAVQSPIPVVVDENGRLKAQVRAGRWTIQLTAFRIDDPKEFSYDSKPAVGSELVAFQAQPDFRMVEIEGSPLIDVSQVPFPDAWRNFPVYRWDTATPFRIVERLRGMGAQRPEGLTIARTWWLDEKGRSLTFRDQITGTRQEIWRLDAAPGLDLGSVRSQNQGQLITRNPETDAPGVEIRTRNLNLEATGRMARDTTLSATGWLTDADALNVTLNLPPGWRLLALFGADWVHGDWLTAWTLLDLFLLLIFTLAVYRLQGLMAAVLAFLAFGISHQEPGAPCYLWLILLIPIALLRVVPSGWGHKLLSAAKWLTLAALIIVLIPFLAAQVQQTLYPQLEVVQESAVPLANQSFELASPMMVTADQAMVAPPPAPMKKEHRNLRLPQMAQTAMVQALSSSNLQYDDKARIQTGPGVPDWHWRTVTFGWNGPVQSTQTIRPILISLTMERLLTVVRIFLLLALVTVLLRRRIPPLPNMSGKMATLFFAGIFLLPAATAQAQFPDATMLNTLRDRLLAPSDAYPHAADIPSASLTLQDRQLTVEAQIHTAIQTAVPLPARVADWSPVTVTVDGQPTAVLRRDNGSLWVVLPPGVHTVRMEGLLPEVSEWQWSFALKPRHVTVTAPDWTVSGVQPNGLPGEQIFFVRQQKSEAGVASYDRQNLHPLVVVDRQLELGLVWQVRTTVTRLSAPGQAITLRIPILPGENVTTAQIEVREGRIEVNLSAQEQSFSWQSELTPVKTLALTTQKSDPWIERWHLVASPVWNVALSGLPPIFESHSPDLVPVWHPWPGESVALTISQPVPIEGSTVTVNSGTQAVSLGQRQRTTQLDLSIRSSLAEDFLVELPAEAQVTSLTLNGQALPVRKDGHKVIAPLRPGEQTLSLGWKTDLPLRWKASADAVSLPVESANIETTFTVPDNRWVLATSGPLRGPAVRFWTILVCSLLAAWVLGRISASPLRTIEWMLLALGLTQVPLPAALLIVAWFFFLVLRGREACLALSPLRFNLVQIALILLTAIALGIFLAVVGAGLLGHPEMFISGNGSTRAFLRWYQPQSGLLLPQPACFAVSLWWYRLLMLIWALWIAVSLLRWLRWGWDQFSRGGCFRGAKK